jgi:hypothetical protein
MQRLVISGLDTAIDRGTLYFLIDNFVAPKVNVFKLNEQSKENPAVLVESYDIFSEVGVLPFWMGMAVYPSQGG